MDVADGSGGLPGFNMGSIQSLGIINALKTGDPKLDMILALLLPFALNFLLTSVANILKFVKNAWNRYFYKDIPNYHERCISHRSQYNDQEGYRMNLEDNKNDILINALKLFLDAKVDMKLKTANVDLTESPGERNYGLTIASTLSKCHIVKNPPASQWHKLGEYGKPSALVELKIKNQEDISNNNNGKPGSQGSGGRTVEVKTFCLRSLKGQAVDDFLDTAYKWYIDELRKSEDTSRYFYDLEADERPLATRNSNLHRRNYTRFRLSNEKTFDSLFFPEKDAILRLVGNFMDKKGKYAIRVSRSSIDEWGIFHICDCSCLLLIAY